MKEKIIYIVLSSFFSVFLILFLKSNLESIGGYYEQKVSSFLLEKDIPVLSTREVQAYSVSVKSRSSIQHYQFLITGRYKTDTITVRKYTGSVDNNKRRKILEDVLNKTDIGYTFDLVIYDSIKKGGNHFENYFIKDERFICQNGLCVYSEEYLRSYKNTVFYNLLINFLFCIIEFFFVRKTIRLFKEKRLPDDSDLRL